MLPCIPYGETFFGILPLAVTREGDLYQPALPWTCIHLELHIDAIDRFAASQLHVFTMQLIAALTRSNSGSLTEGTQRHIMEHCFHSSEAAEFPPPLEFRRKFLKVLARAAESSQNGVDEPVMDALGKLLVLPASQVPTTQIKSSMSICPWRNVALSL